MKTRIKNLLLVMLGIGLTLSLQIYAYSETNLSELKSLTNTAFLKFDETLFYQANGLCDRILSQNPKDADALYYSAYTQYRLINISNSNGKRTNIDQLIESAISHVQELFKNDVYKVEARVLQAAIYMMKISISPSDAPTLSMKINTLLGESKAIDKSNPRISLIQGIMLLQTPPQFGGSIEKAISEFDNSIELFKNEKDSRVVWGNNEVKAWKGIALEKIGKKDDAIKIYEHALVIEPEFSWIKNILLPKAKKLTKTNNDDSTKIDLTVKITDFENDNGVARVGLYSSKSNYEIGKKLLGEEVKIVNGCALVVFKNVSAGEYAIKCYHDANENNKLDKGAFGIPTEEYGFSNNASANFGPADYDDAKFKVDKASNKITFTMQ